MLLRRGGCPSVSQLQHQIRLVLDVLDPVPIGFVDFGHPVLGLHGRLPESNVPGDQAATSFVARDIEVPNFGEQFADRRPRLLAVEQIVTFGDDESGYRSNWDASRNRLFDPAVEGRGVDDVFPGPDTFQERRISVPVERVDGPLAPEATQPLQLRVGEMEAVHRNADGPEGFDDLGRERRLAGTRRTGDAEHDTGVVAQQPLDAQTEFGREHNWKCATTSEPAGELNKVTPMTPPRREPQVVVLGGGSWGTTVASIASRRSDTLQWVRSAETAEDINENHRNERYLGDEVELSASLKATTDFERAADRADVIVMAVPSHGFRGVLTELRAYLRPWVPIVSLVKGLEQGTSLRMSQIIEEVMPGHPAGILAGPNIAREVAQGYAAAAVMAMPDQHLSTRLAQMFRTQRFRVYTTDDVLGVEMAGALKNVYAIATGMGYSLGIGENTRAMVIARALREMTKLGVAMGGQPETFPGLAGLGDLIVTCTSPRSRNRHVGEQIGAGKPIDEILASMDQVAEGVKAASVIMELAERYGVHMPIAREVDGVINHGNTVDVAYKGLAAEPEGHEIHGAGF